MTTEALRADVAIIGAGPVGLFAIFECGMLRHALSCVRRARPCRAASAARSIRKSRSTTSPAIPASSPPIWSRNSRNRRRRSSPFIHLGQQVVALSSEDGDGWLVESAAGTRVQATAVIVAAGVGAFGPNRPPLAGIERLRGPAARRGRALPGRPARRLSRSPGGDRRRRRFGRRLGAVAGAGGGARQRRAPPRQVPGGAGERRASCTRWPRAARSSW